MDLFEELKASPKNLRNLKIQNLRLINKKMDGIKLANVMLG